MALRCINGHDVPDGFRFCGICDGAIDSASRPQLVGAAAGGNRGAWPPAPMPAWEMPRPLGAPPVHRPEPDGDGAHLLRYLCVGGALSLLQFTGPGYLIAVALVCDRTGYRKRDVLLWLVPFVNIVVSARVVWRATARNVYWSTRRDRRSDVLRGGLRIWAIGIGAAAPFVFAAMVAAMIALAPEPGWSDAERSGFTSDLVGRGVNPAVASCMVDHVAAAFPEPHGDYTEAEVDSVMSLALASCPLP